MTKSGLLVRDPDTSVRLVTEPPVGSVTFTSVQFALKVKMRVEVLSPVGSDRSTSRTVGGLVGPRVVSSVTV